MRLQKSFLKLYKIFFILSIIIIISGIHTYRSSLEFKQNAIETTAIVTDIRERLFPITRGFKNYTISISYLANGKDYNTFYYSSYLSSSTMSFPPKKNSKIRIYYDKTNPKKISGTTYDNTGIIIIILGSILCVILLFLIIKELKK